MNFSLNDFANLVLKNGSAEDAPTKGERPVQAGVNIKSLTALNSVGSLNIQLWGAC